MRIIIFQHSIKIILLVAGIVLIFGLAEKTYGEVLDKIYTNTDCGISIQYPVDWKGEETPYNSLKVINAVVEFEPDNDEGFNNVVTIELDDISGLPDKSFTGVKEFEEDYISTGVAKIESSETIKVDGHPAQKIVYTEPGMDNDRFKKMEVHTVAFGKDYVLIYDTTNSNYFDLYSPVFESMIKNFKISSPEFDGITC